MKLKETLNWRYSAKEFLPDKKLSNEHLEQVKELLQMSPSSINVQPWHFIIATSEESKERLAKGTRGMFSYNEKKVKTASHVVLFCARTSLNDEYLKRLLELEDADGRYPTEEIKQNMYAGRDGFIDIHKYELKDLQHWMEKQVYLNIGAFLLGVASLGIDAVPMEGLDINIVDEEFGLREKGLTSIVMVALGYRTEGDFNNPEKTPKSRLPKSELFTMI